MRKYKKRLGRLERVKRGKDFPVYAVFPEKGKPYVRTKSGRKAGLNEFPGAVVKAYVGKVSPDDWNEMEGDK